MKKILNVFIAIFLISILIIFLFPSDLFANTTQIRSFVTRFYQQCLGREPDTGGLNYWSDRLANGTITGAQLAYNFITSSEFTKKNVSNEDFTTMMYRAFFDRAPDSGGYSYWLGKLNQGVSRISVLAGFVNSTEFKNLCTKYGINPGSINVSVDIGIAPPSRGSRVTEDTSIVGYSSVTVDELVRMFSKYNPYKVDRARRIATYYVKYGRIFNIRADIAWAQMCHETNFLRYTGIAKEGWNNFCGLGVTGSPDVGERFATEELGVIAHLIHLAWYVYPDHLNIRDSSGDLYCSNKYDPRHFGSGHNYNGDSTLGALNERWAPAPDYTYKIIQFANEI